MVCIVSRLVVFVFLGRVQSEVTKLVSSRSGDLAVGGMPRTLKQGVCY